MNAVGGVGTGFAEVSIRRVGQSFEGLAAMTSRFYSSRVGRFSAGCAEEIRRKDHDEKGARRGYQCRYYWAAVTLAGAQKRSKALVSSAAMAKASRISMSRLSSMKATFPSRIKVIEGDEGG